MGSVAYIVKIHHRLDLCAAILKIRLLRVSIRNIAPNHRPWHSAEPVVRLAQARNAGCADGDGIEKEVVNSYSLPSLPTTTPSVPARAFLPASGINMRPPRSLPAKLHRAHIPHRSHRHVDRAGKAFSQSFSRSSQKHRPGNVPPRQIASR